MVSAGVAMLMLEAEKATQYSCCCGDGSNSSVICACNAMQQRNPHSFVMSWVMGTLCAMVLFHVFCWSGMGL